MGSVSDAHSLTHTHSLRQVAGELEASLAQAQRDEVEARRGLLEAERAQASAAEAAASAVAALHVLRVEKEVTMQINDVACVLAQRERERERERERGSGALQQQQQQ